MRASTGVRTVEQQASINLKAPRDLRCLHSLCLPYMYVKGLVRFLGDFKYAQAAARLRLSV